MKKISLSLLTICMAAFLAACGGEASASEPAAEEKTMKEKSNPPAPQQTAEVLSLQKSLQNHYKWDDDTLLVQSEYSYVTMREADAENYPEMAEMLEQLSGMQKRSMEDEFDNFCSFAQEELAERGVVDTYISTLDIQVRRADSIAVSLLSDSFSDTGMIEEYRGMHGSNFDTETGRELQLSDVIVDMEKVPAIVEQELNSHLWAGDFYSETAVADYFSNTPEDGISWTLDYNGVTFYFADGDLAEPGNGRQAATVSFAAHPELFNEKYMTVPEGYIVGLPLDHSFFVDLDGDKDMEELNCSGYFDPDMGMYSSFGIYTDLDGHYHYEELFADAFDPYYVKTADGKHYIYLFCTENEGAFGLGHLVVYDVTGGGLKKVGERNAAPFYLPQEEYAFILPTDPAVLWLDDPDYGNDGTIFAVGEDGMPKTERETVGGTASVLDTDALVEIAFDEASFEGTQWYGCLAVDPESGEEVSLPYTDETTGMEVGAKLELNEDGTGYLDYKPIRSHLTWYCEDNTLCLEMEGGWNCYGSLYDGAGENLWMMLQVEEEVIWLN